MNPNGTTGKPVRTEVQGGIKKFLIRSSLLALTPTTLEFLETALANVLLPVIAFLLTAFVSTPVAFAATPSGRPNIVLILADDLGYGDLSCYGARDIATPNLDGLAREGARFTSFYVAQPVCTASRAALLTGCYPNRVGMAGALNHTSMTGIHSREALLSELLRGQGYATAIFGKWHLGHQPPFLPTRRGFDEFFGIPYSNDNGPLHPVTRGIPSLPLYENDKVVELDPDQSQFTRRLTEKAAGFIDRHRQKPFFSIWRILCRMSQSRSRRSSKGLAAVGFTGMWCRNWTGPLEKFWPP